MTKPAIPTAEQHLKSNPRNLSRLNELAGTLWTSQVLDDMVSFAKLHVEAALICAAENADVYPNKRHDNGHPMINKETIINSYDLNNIK